MSSQIEEDSKDGSDILQALDEELVTKNLSNLGRTADGTKFSYLNLSIPGLNLSDIACLSKFKELQTLNLSNNNLNDLSVLSELPFLLYLNVSNNKIEKLFDFLPSYNLKEADFSFNRITEIGNLSNFHYLQSLQLNNNQIKRIEGLEYCHRLKNLNLAHNLIKKIEGLENLPLLGLDLRSNQIKKIEGLEPLKYLRFLNLSGNMIKFLHGIPEKHEFLEQIDFENNRIASLSEIEHLTALNLLRDLNLISNPVREAEDYYSAVIFKLPKLVFLDNRKIDSNDKVNAKNLFHPSAEYIASRDHMTNFIFNIIQDHKVRESTLPNIDSPYPILLLCGPEGSGTSHMATRLAKQFPEYFDYVYWLLNFLFLSK
ncbi:Leucine-rich repeat and guanylate kinase domain-containing [Brachionus plicatilis]|uniref:Leucine-rich repeat and guanylate kinase domain-containing n=1 Tax=Brachionus plicatilis TaxID=10195 RepID=A0A3M7Q316_BRAPC|nr:Leucine-rich repeat and guanylate kinase domain-containing [Brachionus plicatilis]